MYAPLGWDTIKEIYDAAGDRPLKYSRLRKLGKGDFGRSV
jgi:hypothetical protein